MKDNQIDVLLIEDNLADAKLIEYMLKDVGPQYNVANTSTFGEGMKALNEKTYDLLLLDLSLPDSFGMQTVENATKEAPNVPIIILTGRDDEEFALEVVKAGAQDYLIKGQFEGPVLARTIRYAIQRKQLEANLQQKNMELLRANKTLDRFVYIISHDLKKPVANIIGLMTLFEKEVENVLSDRGKMIFGKISTSINDLKQMMEDLLESTRKEAAENKNLEQIDFAKLYDTIKTSIEQLIVSTGAKITTDFSQCPTILYSYQDMKSIMHNLISNALIYRSPDRAPEILVKTEKTLKGACLIVKDNGRGIDLEKEKDKLFKKYSRFHTDVEGTGLGLWLIKEITEKNGGSVSVESTVNVGTTFKVFF